MRYSDISAFVKQGYVDLGYDTATVDFPLLDPGPPTDPGLQKLSAQRQVFLTLGGGAGLTTEALYDRIFLSTRVFGRQDDYADAENLAAQLDYMLLAATRSGPATIGTARCLYITRTGGAPQLLLKDTADRYHLSCSYIIETGTGL